MKESERWLILMSRSSAEWNAYTNLLRRGINAYYPFEIKSVRRQRWDDGVAKPIYPGYLFAEMNSAKSIQQIEEIPGIASVLKSGGELVLIPTLQVDAIKRKCSELYQASLPRRADVWVPGVGDVVTIPHGMFMGVPAIITTIDNSGWIKASIGNLEVSFYLTDLQKVSVAVRSHGEQPQSQHRHHG